jgi:outer membrane protein
MKKIIIAIVALISLSACTEQKIAYVNSEELMKEYHVMKDYQAELKKQEEAFQAKYEKEIAAIQGAYQEFQKNAAKMGRKNAEARNAELSQKFQQIQQQQQAEAYQLQQESQEKMSSLLKEVTDFVAEYGKKNKYTYILGTSEMSGNVLYGDEKLDITDVVLEALNADSKEEKSEEKIEETTKEVEKNIENKKDSIK